MLKPVSDFIAEAQAQCKCLDAESAKILFFDEADSVVIIDVREPHEATESKLKHSINIPRGLLEMKITGHCPDHDTTILIHCAAGGRASLAAARLKEMGYTKVHPITAKFDEIKETFG